METEQAIRTALDIAALAFSLAALRSVQLADRDLLESFARRHDTTVEELCRNPPDAEVAHVAKVAFPKWQRVFASWWDRNVKRFARLLEGAVLRKEAERDDADGLGRVVSDREVAQDAGSVHAGEARTPEDGRDLKAAKALPLGGVLGAASRGEPSRQPRLDERREGDREGGDCNVVHAD